MARSKARFADSQAAKTKKKTKTKRMAAAKETPDSDVTQQQQSSSESEVDETALGVLLAEPRRAKSDPDPATNQQLKR